VQKYYDLVCGANLTLVTMFFVWEKHKNKTVIDGKPLITMPPLKSAFGLTLTF